MRQQMAGRVAWHGSASSYKAKFISSDTFLTLFHIIAATLVGGSLSTLAAGLLSLHVLSRITQRLVSLSAGLLLGAATIDLLPEAIASGEDPEKLGWTLGLGFLGFLGCPVCCFCCRRQCA